MLKKRDRGVAARRAALFLGLPSTGRAMGAAAKRMSADPAYPSGTSSQPLISNGTTVPSASGYLCYATSR